MTVVQEPISGKKTTARDILRLATAPAHVRLHRTPLLAAFGDSVLSVTGYVELMRLFRAFYRELDPQLTAGMAKFNAGRGQFNYIPRAPMFDGDLQALGQTVSHDMPHGQLPALRLVGESPASLAGGIYVVEGSILGGTGLNRCARRILHASDTKGRAYWQWCSQNAGSRWPAALEFIEWLWATGGSREQMTEAARTVFDSLHEVFSALSFQTNDLTVSP
jgi:heme oxygenase